jgi:hypothetical protein
MAKATGMIHISAAFLAFLYAVFAPTADALAQDHTLLRKILADPGERQHVLDASKRSSVVLHNPCPSADFQLTGGVAIFAPPAADQSGAVRRGAWKQSVREQGCGQDRILNVLVVVRGPKTLATAPLLPGTTHADPTLERDAARYAWIAAQPAMGDCKSGYIAETRYIGTSGVVPGSGARSVWREMWHLVACGRNLNVPLLFTPDTSGTTIAAAPPRSLPQK